MSNTIFVVEQGAYSDYRVVGVFTSRENAQTIADAINGGGYHGAEASVAEWPLDPAVTELNQGYHQYVVDMRRDGTTERCDRLDISGYDLAGSVRIWERTKAPAYKGKGIPDCLQASVWAKDETHAVKIVNEHRTRMIASGEF